MKVINKVSNKANDAVSTLWSYLGELDNLGKKDLEFLNEQLTEAQNLVINKMNKIKPYSWTKAPVNKSFDTALSRKLAERGDEIDEFYFIDYTRSGCPKISKRAIGDKGITLIEISNVGRSFATDCHLKKVRVTGIDEDGEQYQLYFNNVWTKLGMGIGLAYKNEVADFYRVFNAYKKEVIRNGERYEDIVDDTYVDIIRVCPEFADVV